MGEDGRRSGAMYGVNEESKGRGKEGCALLMSPKVWEGIKAHEWKGSRKVGMVKYA